MSRHRRAFGLSVILAGVAFCCALSGCKVTEDADYVVFSPDGTKVAYVWRESKQSGPINEIAWNGKKTEWIGIVGDSIPESVRLFKAREIAKGPAFLAKFTVRDLAFSDDGRYLAYIKDDRIDVLDIHSTHRWTMTPEKEKVSSFRWIGPYKLAYFTVQPADPEARPMPEPMWDEGIIHKTGFTQDIFDEPEERQPLFADRRKLGVPTFKEYWSPDRRSVLLIETQRMALLDVKTGFMKFPVYQRYGRNRGVAWKPDSSAVFCGYGWPWDHSGPKGGIQIDRATGEVIDVSDQIEEDMVTDWFEVLAYTADGNYVIVRSAMELSLIRVQPWRAILLELERDKFLPRFGNELRMVKALKPGWLQLKVVDYGTTYAVDYMAQWIVPVAKNAFALSADKTKVAEVFDKGVVNIRPLELPYAPPIVPKPKKAEHGDRIDAKGRPIDDDGNVIYEEIADPKTGKAVSTVPKSEPAATSQPASAPAPSSQPAATAPASQPQSAPATPSTQPSPPDMSPPPSKAVPASQPADELPMISPTHIV